MRNQIFEALSKLDVRKDEHWTKLGLPKLEVVSELSGLSELKRSDIEEHAPEFTRENNVIQPVEDVVKSDKPDGDVESDPVFQGAVDTDTIEDGPEVAKAEGEELSPEEIEQMIKAVNKSLHDKKEEILLLNKEVKAEEQRLQEYTDLLIKVRPEETYAQRVSRIQKRSFEDSLKAAKSGQNTLSVVEQALRNQRKVVPLVQPLPNQGDNK